MAQFRFIMIMATLHFSILDALASNDILYHIDDDDSYSAVDQSHGEAPPKRYMRDPDTSTSSVRPVKTIKKTQSKKAQITYTPSEHQFSPAVISGKLRKPRVNFVSPNYKLSRLPDRLPKEFLQQNITVDE